MSTKYPSQNERYGEMLSNDKLYENSLGTKRLADEEEDRLAQCFFAGDQTAKEPLLMSLFRYVKCTAKRLISAYQWLSPRIEYLDMVQVGNETILQKFDDAFAKPAPAAYLKTCAKYAMQDYCVRYDSLIVLPDHHKTRVPVESLDVPAHHDSEDLLCDMLIDQSWGQPPTAEKEVEGLHKAIATALTAQQYEILVYLYGLYEHAPHSVGEIQKVLGIKHHSLISAQHQVCLKKIRQVLQEPTAVVSEIYTIEEACVVLGVTKENFSKNITRRYKLTPHTRGFYLKSDIDALAQARQRQKQLEPVA